ERRHTRPRPPAQRRGAQKGGADERGARAPPRRAEHRDPRGGAGHCIAPFLSL
ncbi:MAG: hypothetical protein AVDCRST_MAG18-2740, partial [uncultured Thermomicrobiales bacterium]